MSQQRLIRSPEKTTQQIARREPSPATSRSFQVRLHPIPQLQRMLGNQRVAQLIQANRLTPEGNIIGRQRKLTVGAADDQYEQEADRVARQVLSTPSAVAAASVQRSTSPEQDQENQIQTKSLAASITPVMQRLMGNETVKDKPVQPKSAGSLADSFEAGGDVESQVSLSKGRGSPLPDSVRAYMEPRFGVDFSEVRVHGGSDAIPMNRAVGAQAFTHGSDIYFGAESSPANLELTAHELSHVVQQTGGVPLPTKRLAETDSIHANLSMQRTCSACAVEKKMARASDPMISKTPSVNTAEPLIQRDKIEHGALTWDDFQGKVPKKANYDAATFSSFEDPDLKALIPTHAAVDTGEPCKAKGKNLTRFTVDITIDSARIEVKSFMDQDKSWHKPWTTEEPDRRKKCEKEMSPKCEKSFKGQFAKIKKSVAKAKAACQKEFDKMKKAGRQGLEYTQTVEGESTTATTKAECQTKLAPELEKLLRDQATWEATMSGASTTVNKPGDCWTTFVDACATELMQAGSDDLLKHEQTHFDLTDAMAQKARADLRALVDSFPTEVDACGQKAAEAKAKTILASQLKKMKANNAANKKVLKSKQAKYDKETKHGTVEKKQTAWEEKISEGF